MSDCDWVGMNVFGTQPVGLAPSQAPTGIVQTVSADIDEFVSVTQTTGATFTNIRRNHSDDLRLTITRNKINRPVLVTLNLTGHVNGFTGSTRIQFQLLVAGLQAFTRTADITNRLLVTSVFVAAVDPVHPSTFSAFLKTLVPAAQLQNLAALEFLVQFQYAGGTDTASALLNLDPKADALVLQEIGPSALT